MAKDLRVRCDCPCSVMVDVGDAALRSKQSSSPRLSARRNWTHPRALPVPQPRAGTQESSANEDEESWDEGTLRCRLDQGFSAAACRAFSSQHLIPFATINPIFSRQSPTRRPGHVGVLPINAVVKHTTQTLIVPQRGGGPNRSMGSPVPSPHTSSQRLCCLSKDMRWGTEHRQKQYASDQLLCSELKESHVTANTTRSKG